MKSGTCGLTTLKRWEPSPKVLPMIMVLPLRFLPMLRRLLMHVLMTPGGILNEPLTYDEIANVCSKLKLGVCGVLLDYEHIRYAGPRLWSLLFILYQECFCQFSVPKNIKKGIIFLCLRVKVRKQITKIATVA